MGTLLAGAASDAGQVREQNEDFVQLADPASPQVAQHGFLAVLADGMGGHQHGEVASSLAVETLFTTYYAGDAGGDYASATRLKQGFKLANDQIMAQTAATAGESSKSMGTTMVATAIVGDQLTVANVGDSRAYLVRAESATQITHDHSLVAEQVKAGVMSPEEARESNQRNIITRTLGHRPRVDVDIFEISLLPDDRVILCSDGVHGHVEPEEFVELSLHQAPENACRALIDLAMQRGSTDNVSAALVCFEPSTVPTAAPDRELVATGGRRLSPVLLLLLIVLVAAIAGVAYLYLSGTFG